MPLYELVGQSAQDSDNIAANPSRLLNMYRERVMPGGRTQHALRSVLGQEAKDDIGSNPVRSMGRADGKNWLVGDGKLYEVASDGTVTNRGTVADDENTTIAGNYTDVTVVSGNNYYVYDGSVTQPTTKAFTNVGSHCYVGGYTVITEKDGKRFQWSGQGNAQSLNALHFASADNVDDNILRAVEYGGYLVLFCETSLEIWAVTGAGATAFSRVETQNIGLKSFNLFVRFDDALFFIGNDGRAYLFQGGATSAAPIETSLDINTATHCFYYEDQGHKNCVVRFSDRPAWVFDVTEREWHERSETAGHTAWSATHSLRNGSTWLVGNDEGGVMELARTNMDRAGPLYRRVIGYTIFTGEKFSPSKVELLGRVGRSSLDDAITYALALGSGFVLQVASGVGLALNSTPAGPRDAYVDLYESGDGGITWKGPYARSMGGSGDTNKRMTWRQRGQFQQYTPRFDISDAADLTLYATAIIE